MTRNQSTIDRAARVAALLTTTLVAAACSSSDKNAQGNPSTADASTGGTSSGGQGGASSGGKGGASSGGQGGASSGGKGGTGAKGGTAGNGGKAATDASTPDAESDGSARKADSGDASPPLAQLSGTLYATGSTYSDDAGEIIALDLATGNVLGNTSIADGDIAVSESGGTLFAVEREGGAVDVMSATLSIQHHIVIDTGDGGSSFPNPHNPLFVSATKAYVPLNAANAIAIIDPTAGTQTGLVSLAPFLDPSDADGSTEPDAVYYDAASHRAYFVLPRTDIFSGNLASDFMPACPPDPALVIALDTTTDTVVDLNGASAGQGYPLPLVSPGYAVPLSAAGAGQFLLVFDGCNGGPDGGALRAHHGIASLDLATGATQSLYTPTAQGFLGGLFGVGTSYLLEEDSSLRPWSTATPTTLGAALVGVPNGAVVASDTTLVGHANEPLVDGGVGPAAVRYEIATGRKTPLAPIPFSKDWGYISLSVVK